MLSWPPVLGYRSHSLRAELSERRPAMRHCSPRAIGQRSELGKAVACGVALVLKEEGCLSATLR